MKFGDLSLVGVYSRSRRGYYVMDSGRRIRFYPWPGGAPTNPLSRQRVEAELGEEKERLLDEHFEDWASLQVRVREMLGLNF